MDILCFGEPLVGFYPPMGTSLSEDVPVIKTWGGDTSNVALGVAKLGKRSAFLSRVGDDPFGKGFMQLWNRSGVDTALVEVDSQRNTGLYFVSFEGKSHKLTYYRKNSAASVIQPECITKKIVEPFSSIHLSGISIGMSASAQATGIRLVQLANQLGKIVSFDVNYRSAQWNGSQEAATQIREIIQQGVNILEITDDEMSALGWGDSPSTLCDLFPDVEIIILKQGHRGATILFSNEVLSVPACPITVSDTVGAGDSFDSGFLVSLLDGKDVCESARFATVCAAHTCTGTGPLEKMPTRDEVETLIEKTGYGK